MRSKSILSVFLILLSFFAWGSEVLKEKDPLNTHPAELFLAIEENVSLDGFNLLLEKCEDNMDWNVKEEGNTLLSKILSPVVQRLDLVKPLLKKEVDPNVNIEPLGMTVLDYVTFRGWDDIVEALLKKGANPNRTVGKDSVTPLNLSISASKSVNISREKVYERIIRLLLEYGANPNRQDKNGQAALHCIFYGPQSETRTLSLVKLLLEKGGDPNLLDHSHLTPLFYAVYYQWPWNIIHTLIKKGASPVASERTHQMLVFLAIVTQRLELIQWIVQEKVNLNIQYEKGETPLHIALMVDHLNIEMIHHLIKGGAPLNLKNSLGQTPLHLTVKRNHSFLTRLLLEKGADINQRDLHNKTPFDDASSEQRAFIYQKLLALHPPLI